MLVGRYFVSKSIEGEWVWCVGIGILVSQVVWGVLEKGGRGQMIDVFEVLGLRNWGLYELFFWE